MNKLVQAGRIFQIRIRRSIVSGKTGYFAGRKMFPHTPHLVPSMWQLWEMRISLSRSANQKQTSGWSTLWMRGQQQIDRTRILQFHILNPVMLRSLGRDQCLKVDAVALAVGHHDYVRSLGYKIAARLDQDLIKLFRRAAVRKRQ